MSNRMHSSIILTRRCNSKCTICNIWKHQTRPADEITATDLEGLPETFFTNIAGGEPFIRRDLEEIVDVLSAKTQRIVISTNGQLTERILDFSERHPDVGIRISVDGLPIDHDHIRGVEGSFDNALRTLLGLIELGRRDIGFAFTVQDRNHQDLLPIYRLTKGLGVELATGVIQNAHFFLKADNRIDEGEAIAIALESLAETQLACWRPKSWLRAYYNAGLAQRARGDLPCRRCEMGGAGGFVTDPEGNVLPCNSHDEHLPMGNLKCQSWEEIWNGPQAERVRSRVAACSKSCWAIGNVAPDIFNHPVKPLKWLLASQSRQLVRAMRAS